MTQLSKTTSLRADAAHPSCGITTPHMVGPWQLVAPIAETRLSEIYRALPEAAAAGDGQPPYVVKLLRRQWRDDPQAVILFQREAVVGRMLSHPNLVPVLAAGADVVPYVVMPYLHGQTLARQMAAGRWPSLAHALWIARQVAQALDALFRPRGWMHADIKPSNIHLGPDGHVTLLDLGLVRPAGQGASLAERPVVGTMQYMAPEMLTSTLAADIRSDIYSLGVVLYEMLARRLPFIAGEAARLAVLHREATPVPLAELVPHLPLPVAELVHRMLAKEPLRRPQSPRELIETLGRLEIACFEYRAA
ncbi:MAG: serine/threonine-protein kinase [Pirellulales bacterium]